MDRKKAVFIVLLVVAFGFLFEYSQALTLENIKLQQAVIVQFISEHFVAATILYFVTYIVATALSVPGALLLTLLGAALFDFWWSVLLVSFASTIGATLAFLVSRYLLRDWVQNRFSTQLTAINQGINNDGNMYLLSLRLIPIFPFFIINLLMGITAMPVRNFYLYSQLGMFPSTLIYLNAGTQLANIESLSGLLSGNVVIALVILGIFPIISKTLINKMKSQKICTK